jgi:hypothetical protein
MSVGRVIGAGLVAGLVLNIGEYLLNAVILAEDWEAAAEAVGVPPMTGAEIGVLVLLGFVIGIALVWLYAAIRPRFGPGAKTAAIAGIFTWFLLAIPPYVWNALNPVYPSRLMMIGAVWAFFEYLIAAMVGGWLYKEGPTAAAVSVAR